MSRSEAPRPELALGTAQLLEPYGLARRAGHRTPEEAEAILRRAFDLGVRCLDTAPVYGAAETAIGDFLQRNGLLGEVAISTKLPALPAELGASEIEGAVARALESSRRRLRRDRLEYYLLHRPADLRRHGDALLDALRKQREEGHVEHLGISIYEPDEVSLALAAPELSAVQLPFNLLDRRMHASGRLGALRDGGRVTFARSLLLQGLLTLAPAPPPDIAEAAGPWLAILGELLARHALSPVQAALGYAAACAGTHYLVLGVETPDQLAEAVAALGRPLPVGFAEEVERRLVDVPRRVIDPRLWRAS